MFPSKVCQPLCNLHAISIEVPTRPVVTQSEKLNMALYRITAHVQCRDEAIHWRDSLIGHSTVYLVLPKDSLYNLISFTYNIIYLYVLYGLIVQLSLDFAKYTVNHLYINLFATTNG